MLMTFKRIPIVQTLMIALALTPAALYAYLGQFSRLMSDDYCTIAISRERGAWGYMDHHLNTWTGSYAHFLFKGLVAPLDTLLPRIMPTATIILWLIGLSWLIDEGLVRLGINSSRRAIATATAALTVTAAIQALHSRQSFYQLEASADYTLPLALLTIYLALTFWLAKRTRLPAWGLVISAALCFSAAGFAETSLIFQLIFLMFCLLTSLAWRRRVYARIFGVGWLAALVGLMIQLNAPGIALRAARLEDLYGRPDRSPLTLLSRALDLTYKYIGYQPIFVGFALLMAVGLLIMLVKYRPPAALKASQIRLALPPLWLGLTVQLLFAPLLWLHTSNIPQFFGRFSLRYMAIIVLNLALILGFAVLLWQRKRINAYLQKQENGLPVLCNGLLATLVFLFALTRVQGIYYYSAPSPSSYLFTTALTLLGVLCWQLSSLLSSAETRKIGLLALCSLGIGLVGMAVIVGAIAFGYGSSEVQRTLSPASYLLTFSGLMWGVFLGWLVKRCPLPSQLSQTWINWIKLGGLAIILIIGLGIVLGQTVLMPDFQRYAQEWDERHSDIIAMRGDGQRHIEIGALSYDLADYIGMSTMAVKGTEYRCALKYYDVDSIAVKDG